MTVLWLSICTSQSLHFFHPTPPSRVVTIHVFTVSMSWFLFSLFILSWRLCIQVKSFVFPRPGWVLQMRFRVRPLRGHLCLQPTVISLWQREFPLIFTAMWKCGCLFLALVLWTGEHQRLRPHDSQGAPLQLRYPSRISAITPESGASHFHVSALPTSLDVASSVNLWL